MSQLASVGIVPRATYDFSELRGGTVRIPIAQRVDVAGAWSLALEFRVYDAAIGEGAAVTLCAAADSSSFETDGPSVLQTKTAKGEDIAALRIDSKTVTPFYQIVRIPADEIGLCLAVILEAQGAKQAGPKLSLSIDLLLRGEQEAIVPAADLVEPVITRPEQEESSSGAVRSKIAAAAQAAMMRRPLRRYPRWREIVV